MLKKTQLAGTELSVSQFCLGAMQFGTQVTGGRIDQLFNVFRDAGGNFYDTAHGYSFWMPCGDGASERILGDYIRRNGCRDESVIATKGGHPAVKGYRRCSEFLTAGRISADIDDSLERLDIDVIDLYWLHRDDPRVPVSDIVGIMNDQVKKGRIRYFGGSNWTAARLDEANSYAKAHGLQPFCASQPRWSMAVCEDEPAGTKRLEPGVLLAFGEDDFVRHTASGMPVIPYSSTARGLFASGAAKPDKTMTEKKLERVRRAEKLAAELGATANQVALSWLLNKPFPVFPILGTSSCDHLRDAIGAADLSLTPGQLNMLIA